MVHRYRGGQPLADVSEHAFVRSQTREELIASSHDTDEIRRYITADSLAYLSEDGLYAFLGGKPVGSGKTAASAPETFCRQTISAPRRKVH